MRQPTRRRPSSAATETGAFDQPERIQGLVQQYAGVIAGERPSGCVRTVKSGGEPDQQQARVGIAERCHGPAVIRRILLAPLGQERGETRAKRAVMSNTVMQ